LCLEFDHPKSRVYGASHLYAFYGHLKWIHPALKQVKQCVAIPEGSPVGATGVSGNATNTPPHLHFEIRTTPCPGRGLAGRIDPGEILGYDYYRSNDRLASGN
jgi:murein DD-endopeptidase MepM/ murein hydrolase activator NlpD